MLLFKIIIAPVLIGLISLAGRRWGHGISGWLLGLPVNAGPILAFMVLQEGRSFASAAAIGCLLGMVAWAAFVLIYALCCPRLPWWASMLIGWAAYGIVAFLLLPVHLGAGWTFILVASVLTTMLFILPRPSESDPVSPPGKYELWLRMITATIMVVAITGVAKALGPQRSGILIAFPAFTTVLVVFSHQQSASSAVKTLRGVNIGLYTIAMFFLVLSTCLVRMGAVLAFALALAAAVLVQGVSLVFVRKSSN